MYFFNWSINDLQHRINFRCIADAAAAKSLQSCPTLQPHRLQPTRLLHPLDFPGKSTGVGGHCLPCFYLLLCLILWRWAVKSVFFCQSSECVLKELFICRCIFDVFVWRKVDGILLFCHLESTPSTVFGLEVRHCLDGHEFERNPGVGDGQGGLECCKSWGRKESDTTEQLNWTEQNWTA